MDKDIDDITQKHLEEIISKLNQAGILRESTIVLVGSVAREKRTLRSDTDFLVITHKATTRWRIPIDVHLHLETRTNFIKKLREGNDFEAWAVRFGRVLIDESNWWSEALADEGCRVWPDWRLKIEHARKRQVIAAIALSDGDLDVAEEEYLMMAAHLTRALLLRARVFPLSRPEMPAQLISIGFGKEAHLLAQLITGINDISQLKEIARRLEDCMENLAKLVNERTVAQLT